MRTGPLLTASIVAAGFLNACVHAQPSPQPKAVEASSAPALVADSPPPQQPRAPKPPKPPQAPLPPMPAIATAAPPPPGKPGDTIFAARMFGSRSQSSPPAIIATDAIAEADEAQLKEDLTVMDRLLAEQTVRASGDFSPHAMGIKLMLLGPAEPTYIEGLGALFSYRVSVPLGPGKGGGTKDKPAGPPSAWERARKELAARNTPDAFNPMAVNGASSPPEFDQDKLDQLINSIVRILPEASHMRHVGNDEFIVVTIVGTDADGVPMRLTIKARKSDIDKAGCGDTPAEEFAKAVARRIR